MNPVAIVWLIRSSLSATPMAFAQTSPTTIAAAPATPQIVVPSYPDTAPGFEKFVGQMVELAKTLTTEICPRWNQLPEEPFSPLLYPVTWVAPVETFL